MGSKPAAAGTELSEITSPRVVQVSLVTHGDPKLTDVPKDPPAAAIIRVEC